MKKVTRIQVEGEIKTVESEINKLRYHLLGLNSEKKKTEQNLEDLQWRLHELKSYL